MTIEHPTRMRIPSDRREPRDLSYYPARTCGELAEPIGISGFGSPVGFGGLLNCLTPGESDPYSRSLSDPFRLIHLRTLFALSHATARSKPCVFSRLRTLLRVVCISIIPRHLAVLCFHTLTHSFARLKMSTPLFSSTPALFAKNTRGGGRGYFSPHPDGDADREKSSAEGRLSKSQRLDSSLRDSSTLGPLAFQPSASTPYCLCEHPHGRVFWELPKTTFASDGHLLHRTVRLPRHPG